MAWKLGNFEVSDSGTITLPDGSTTSFAKVTTGNANISSSWVNTTGTFNQAHSGPAMVLLPNGKTLVVGGSPDDSGFNSSAKCELYDPATGLWTDTGDMNNGREWGGSNHVNSAAGSLKMVVLTTGPNAGNVLVAGGWNSNIPIEIYNVNTGTWSNHGTIPSNQGNGDVHLARFNDGSGRIMAHSNGTPQVYDPVADSWSSTSGFNTFSAGNNGTELVTLLDGTILAVGGQTNSFGTPKQAQLYDPITNTWSLTTGFQVGQRYLHAATVMQDGRVLITGGLKGNSPNQNQRYAYGEIYDPATQTFTQTPITAGGNRFYHASMLLPDGRVWIFGGQEESVESEIYDPISNTFTAEVVNSNVSSWWCPIVLQPSGKILVGGGYQNGASALYTPRRLDGVEFKSATSKTTTIRPSETVTASYNITLPASVPASQLPLSLGTDGAMIVGPLTLGNQVVGPTSYGPPVEDISDLHANELEATGSSVKTWAETATTKIPRERHTVTKLQDGRVLVAGGRTAGGGFNPGLSSCELYDPNTNTWRFTGSMPAAKYGHQAVLLANGQVLVANGNTQTSPFSSNPSNICYLFDPNTETWTQTGSTARSRSQDVRYMNFTLTALADNNTVLITGGTSPTGTYPVSNAQPSELYDISNGTWSDTGAMTHNRGTHKATLLNDGTVLVTGGTFGTGPSQRLIPSNDAETYDPSNGTWTACANTMSDIREDHMQCLLPNGKVLVAGGLDGFDDLNFSSVDIYDPATRMFTAKSAMPEPCSQADMIVLSKSDNPSLHYVLLAGGGIYGNGQILNTSKLYAIETDTWVYTTPLNDTTGHGNYDHLIELNNGLVMIVGGGGFNINNYQSPLSELFLPPEQVLKSTGNTILKGQLQLQDTASSNAIIMQAPALTSSYTVTFPSAQGGAGTALTNDGSGNLSWASGGSSSPAGSNTQIQYNNSGAFGADSGLTYDPVAKTFNATPGGYGLQVDTNGVGELSFGMPLNSFDYVDGFLSLATDNGAGVQFVTQTDTTGWSIRQAAGSSIQPLNITATTGQTWAFGTDGSLTTPGDIKVALPTGQVWAGYLHNGSGNEIMNVNNMELYDDTLKRAIFWGQGTRQLWDNSEIQSIDWNSRQFVDTTGGQQSGNWGTRILNDSQLGNITSIDWENRTLNDTLGNLTFDWSVTGQVSIPDNNKLVLGSQAYFQPVGDNLVVRSGTGGGGVFLMRSDAGAMQLGCGPTFDPHIFMNGSGSLTLNTSNDGGASYFTWSFGTDGSLTGPDSNFSWDHPNNQFTVKAGSGNEGIITARGDGTATGGYITVWADNNTAGGIEFETVDGTQGIYFIGLGNSGQLLVSPQDTGRYFEIGCQNISGGWAFTADGLFNLLPITTTQRDSAAPVAGSVIYNSTLNKLQMYNGTAWETVTSI
jgi:N-acetylneuraminic acid mutarotase